MPICWGFFFFYHECMLNFVKCFLCTYWDYYVSFIFNSNNIVYHVGWFVHAEPFLHARDKSHLVIVYNIFTILQNSVWWYFIEDFYIYVQKDIDLYFLILWCAYMHLVSVWCWPHKMCLGIILQFFGKSLGKISINTFLNFGEILLWRFLVLGLLCYVIFDHCLPLFICHLPICAFYFFLIQF